MAEYEKIVLVTRKTRLAELVERTRPANDVLRGLARVKVAADPAGHDQAEREAGVGAGRRGV
ncbi:hypothetical protein [Archangium sp.]|uniref:hypothetical protein n=1 Tax=Archangium sp. TaxID=1872627 RepID=UPI00286A5EF8|nr:hypothetical protein [Archangium sp.]